MGADGEQAATIAFLSRPDTYGPGTGTVERIDTHGAVVFLAGERAYKLKRAVKFSYMDFSTPALRRRACEAELRLNRRTAAALYLEVRPVTRERGGSLALGGAGEAVDWVLVMLRFAEDALLDRMAERGALTTPLMIELAAAIARFHGEAAPAAEFGGREGIAAVVRINADNLRLAGALFPAAAVEALNAASAATLDRVGDLLDRRRAAGKVRRCHGDLHLRNLALIDSRPTLFDCIEFSDPIACIDVVYDLAFLLMDLWHRKLPAFANAVFNRYLDLADESDALAAMPLFLSLRAAVRAHVVAAQARAAAPGLAEEANDYLKLATRFLQPPPPALVAVGGRSGAGKSTLAYGLAPETGPAPGALVLRSDVLRKRLLGVPLQERLPERGYASRVTDRVYAEMGERAAAALAAGHSVVADAVFAKPVQRDAIAAAAATAGRPFHGLWLEAPISVLERRIEARFGDASDATVAVLRRQLGYDHGPIDWARIDASNDPPSTLGAARRALASSAGRG